MPLNEKKRAYLVGLLGEERVKQLETDLGEANKTLDALGIESKEDKPPEIKVEMKVVEPAADPKPEDKEGKPWFVADMTPEEFTKRLVEVMTQTVNPAVAAATKEQGDKITAQLTQVVAYQSELDRRLKELEGLTPRGFRASKDGPEPDKTKMKDAAPGPDGKANEFLSFVMGAPLQQ